MELFATDTHFIVVDQDDSLWIDRFSGGYETETGSSHVKKLEEAGAAFLGVVYGYIGRLRISQASETRLVFIRQQSLVGKLQGCPVYKILSVLAIPLESDTEILIEPSKSTTRDNVSLQDSNANSHQDLSTSPSHFPSQSVAPEFVGGAAARELVKVKPPPIRSSGVRKIERLEKIDRRMLDEFHKMFTEADSFYYSPQYDITNSIQRQHATGDAAKSKSPKAKKSTTSKSNGNSAKESDGLPQDSKNNRSLWEKADQRFFWNWYMVESLVSNRDEKLHRWILPIIQGFIQSETCVIEQAFDALNPVGSIDIPIRGTIDLWIISRRSRFQAGTRYLRRGVDEQGKVANYVETEQILVFDSHLISFVQVRGSIPVFWSQSNKYRYRPAPTIERDDDETYQAFTKHIQEELSLYERIVIVNLVEKSGKEKVLGDAYINNIIRQNSSYIVYVRFDFHDCCRGMKFENVSFLISKLQEVIRNMNYCWIDSYGSVLKQNGTFRVNCVDCLDRTNVVQTHLAREFLIMQLSKLGLIVPEVGLAGNVKKILQTMWANNGDTLSKQYAGTNALKGDFTRTGERRITGVMKDGMNSANRYYLNQFKDASRQAAIDVMLGVKSGVTEADLTDDKPLEKENTTEQIKVIIEDVKRCNILSEEVVLGSWGLVNAKLNEPDTIDIDAVLILTESNYYVTDIDFSMDIMPETQKVGLQSVKLIELGFDTLLQPNTFWTAFSGSNSSQSLVPNLKINYVEDGQVLSHEFRSSNIRFFNNVPVPIQLPEEMHEALRMLAETIRIAVGTKGQEIVVVQLNPPATKDNSNKPRIPGTGMATSWVNKYFQPNSMQQVAPLDTAPLTRAIASASNLQRFTPKYFRRASSASVPTGEPSRGVKIIDEPSGTSISDELENKVPGGKLHPSDLQLRVNHEYPDLIDFNIGTPVDSQLNSQSLANDLVLPSCGILSPGKRNFPCASLYNPDLIIMDGTGMEGGISPTTHMLVTQAQATVINSPQSNSQVPKLDANILHRHRYSLPANSLGIADPTDSPKRSKTPEITITEEMPSTPYSDIPVKPLQTSKLPGQSTLSIAMRRISRSSEDVNKSRSSGYGISVLGNIASHNYTGFKLPSLFPMTKNDNRASSQQNLCDSLVSLRGSHSDNALRENPFQTSQATQQKRDMVLAPLGKLARGMQNLGANYLDPRKLRDTFKPVIKQDSVEERELEEKKRQCQTLFIDA